MSIVSTDDIERVFREQYGRAVAVLVRAFGDIGLAEEAAQSGGLDHHDRAEQSHRSAAPGRLA